MEQRRWKVMRIWKQTKNYMEKVDVTMNQRRIKTGKFNEADEELCITSGIEYRSTEYF